jgi:hypothetical protein
MHAPVPDLRIVAIDSLRPHEEHDSQRSQPLVEDLRKAQYLVNPPVIAPIGGDEYVILDGANRCFAFQNLDYPHILAQVVSYDSGYVTLDVWHHIVSKWNVESFLDQVGQLDDVNLVSGIHEAAIAHILLPDDRVFAVHAPVADLYQRNAILRQVVGIYQRQAVLDRTAINKPHEVLPLYPDAIALVVFPVYHPKDIIAAAKYNAYLPPGISRHVVQGRAIRVNFPVEVLRDDTASLEDKNETLSVWLQRKFAKRQVRYYAEATYQFDE